MNTTDVLQPLSVTIDQATRLLSVGRTKIYELIGSNEISSMKVGKRRLVVFRSLMDFIERGSQHSE